MKTTITITVEAEDVVAKGILYQLVSAIDARGIDVDPLHAPAPEGSIFYDRDAGGSFYDDKNPVHLVMRATELKREDDQASGPERQPVREFDPIEVRVRHLPVLQKLKRGKLTAKQLASKLPGTWTQQEVSNSLNYLKRYDLVEREVGTRYWFVTPKALAHPLVAA